MTDPDFPYEDAPNIPGWMHYDSAHPHLGGYAKTGDQDSFNDHLWAWLLGQRKVRSVIDVGCGAGHELRWFQEHGCEVLGVEGVPQDTDLPIVQHDFTTGPYIPERRFDLCWSNEFVEHVEERYVGNFLITFAAADLLLMTHAVGSGGHHHVNVQESAYWIKQLWTLFRLNKRLTTKTRALAREHGYYSHTGLAFTRI